MKLQDVQPGSYFTVEGKNGGIIYRLDEVDANRHWVTRLDCIRTFAQMWICATLEVTPIDPVTIVEARSLNIGDEFFSLPGVTLTVIDKIDKFIRYTAPSHPGVLRCPFDHKVFIFSQTRRTHETKRS